jgi:hypothetical protein
MLIAYKADNEGRNMLTVVNNHDIKKVTKIYLGKWLATFLLLQIV